MHGATHSAKAIFRLPGSYTIPWELCEPQNGTDSNTPFIPDSHLSNRNSLGRCPLGLPIPREASVEYKNQELRSQPCRGGAFGKPPALLDHSERSCNCLHRRVSPLP